MKKLMLTAVIAVVPLLAGAQTVWRCGPDGRSYSDVPCSQGQQMAVATAARPAADVQSAQERAAREQRLADGLQRDRLAREAANRGSGLSGMATAPQPAAVKSVAKAQAKHKRRSPAPADADIWRATVPGSRHAKG
jgi:hypothetical protein